MPDDRKDVQIRRPFHARLNPDTPYRVLLLHLSIHAHFASPSRGLTNCRFQFPFSAPTLLGESKNGLLLILDKNFWLPPTLLVFEHKTKQSSRVSLAPLLYHLHQQTTTSTTHTHTHTHTQTDRAPVRTEFSSLTGCCPSDIYNQPAYRLPIYSYYVLVPSSS